MPIRDSDIDLLLIGKTGNGKSALGNAILKRDAFLSKSSYESVTSDVDFEVTEYKGNILKVVDGPGVGDTRLDNECSRKLVIKTMEKAIAANTRGYHAFLLVLRHGGRFTVEDQETIVFLKNIFGQDFVQNYCILVITCGDQLEREARSQGTTFDQWCREQKGIFKELLNECGHRIVFFDNVTQDERKQDAQIDELLFVVNSQLQGRRFTDEQFEKASASREKVLVEAKMPVLRNETLQETSLILQKLENIQQHFKNEDQIARLQELLPRLDELTKDLEEQDKKSGILQEIMDNVRAVRKVLENAIQVKADVAEEKRQMKVDEERIKAKLEQDICKKFEALQIKTQEDREAITKDFEKERQVLEINIRKENEEKAKKMEARLEAEQAANREQIENLKNTYGKTKMMQLKSFFEMIGGQIRSALIHLAFGQLYEWKFS